MKWQLIGTAPTDGTPVLLTNPKWADNPNRNTDTDAFAFLNGRPPTPAFRAPSCGVCYEGHWRPGSYPGSEAAGWHSYNKYKFLVPPTHWAPLPEAPR